jgi:hypothetical protein
MESGGAGLCLLHLLLLLQLQIYKQLTGCQHDVLYGDEPAQQHPQHVGG